MLGRMIIIKYNFASKIIQESKISLASIYTNYGIFLLDIPFSNTYEYWIYGIT